jgi:hypothetical protein
VLFTEKVALQLRQLVAQSQVAQLAPQSVQAEPDLYFPSGHVQSVPFTLEKGPLTHVVHPEEEHVAQLVPQLVQALPLS